MSFLQASLYMVYALKIIGLQPESANQCFMDATTQDSKAHGQPLPPVPFTGK